MFVIGIDPGLATTGYGVVESHQSEPRARAAGVLRTGPEAPVSERLAELFDDVTALLDEYPAQALALEQVFTNRNLHTAAAVGRASGVVLLAAARAGVRVHEFTPSAVKLAVTGYGRATKDQMRYAVSRRLRLAGVDGPADAADALALALCYLQHHRSPVVAT